MLLDWYTKDFGLNSLLKNSRLVSEHHSDGESQAMPIEAKS
jgi:hypothetical protein